MGRGRRREEEEEEEGEEEGEEEEEEEGEEEEEEEGEEEEESEHRKIPIAQLRWLKITSTATSGTRTRGHSTPQPNSLRPLST